MEVGAEALQPAVVLKRGQVTWMPFLVLDDLASVWVAEVFGSKLQGMVEVLAQERIKFYLALGTTATGRSPSQLF
jgi:hypothetical protein